MNGALDPNSIARAEPRWRARRELRRAELPGRLTDWLFDAGSLTRRLRAACPGRFAVDLRGQRWGRPLPGERLALGMRGGAAAWIREVRLLCGGVPWVYARTLIPAGTLRGPARRLTRIGTRPLGEILFVDPIVERGPMEVACLRRGHLLHRRAFAERPEPPDAIWGRRSLFRIQGRPLMVYEIFLPELPDFGRAG